MGAYRRRDRRNEWWVEFVYRGRRIRRRSPLQHGRGAAAYERTLRHELETATAAGVTLSTARPPRFAEYADRWMRDYVQPQNRNASIREKEIILRIHLLPRFASFRLDEIGTAEIDRMIGEYQRSGLSLKYPLVSRS